ncbi:hypothetical protein [Actinacidiphila sp. bgisy160]|uniref:hypothetical protein n=1 Tax=Actinacidiphila sp. bgisy160 TaxID=3413796 RepID=UPI003D72057F
MRFGAATHDIGKALHVAELSAPGSAHERAGRAQLLAQGVTPRLARFAATHGSWTDAAVTMEDLLVSVADKVWKGKRVTELEDLASTTWPGRVGGQWHDGVVWHKIRYRYGRHAVQVKVTFLEGEGFPVVYWRTYWWNPDAIRVVSLNGPVG